MYQSPDPQWCSRLLEDQNRGSEVICRTVNKESLILGLYKRELLSASSRSTMGPQRRMTRSTRYINLMQMSERVQRERVNLGYSPVCFIKRSKQVSSGSAITCQSLQGLQLETHVQQYCVVKCCNLRACL